MRKKVLLTILTAGLILGVSAQKPVISLTFTADNNSLYVPMNSILIENMTQGGDTTLYAPDTVLILNYELGIGEDKTTQGSDFSLSQNYPNPMADKTTVNLFLPEHESVVITISDIMGREFIHQEYVLDQGWHSYTFFPGGESLYFLTVRTDHQSRTIKMFNSPSQTSTSEICELEYNGQQTGNEGYKSGNNLNNFVFNLGDQLKLTASTALGERIIFDTPNGNHTYTFQFASGTPCPGMPTVSDIDGNTYNTVQIGSQCWMAKNLKTTAYRTGTAIPNVTDSTAWSNLTSGAYVWYENDIIWKAKYGALYNWYATVNADGLCPTGWHVPTNTEWTLLTNYIGGTISPHGNELKSCRQENSPLGVGCITSEHPRWNSNSSNWGTDDYGFSGLSGGTRGYYGTFNNIGSNGYWWTSTANPSSNAWGRALDYNNGIVDVGTDGKRGGFSVRCLQDTDSVPTSNFLGTPTSVVAPFTVYFIDLSANSPTSWQWNFGDGGTSTLQNPSHYYNAAGSYTVQLIATNSYGSDTEIKTDYITVVGGVPCSGMPTVTDVDGNVYNTVQIGSQCWMAENLKTTTYRNGTSIPNVTDDGEWSNLTSGAYVWYENDITWKPKYGALYNWFATVDVNGLCPSGWHVPTDNEWTALTVYIGGPVHGNRLKSCRQVNSPLGGGCNTSEHPRWESNSGIWGTEDYGFSGLPGDGRGSNGTFGSIGIYGSWWSSTEILYSSAWTRDLGYSSGDVSVSYYNKQNGYSIRCLGD